MMVRVDEACDRSGPVVWSIGHGAKPIDAFTAVLRAAGVRRLVDVRSVPGSRRHPQFGRDALPRNLRDAGIRYDWCPDLGGFRVPRPDSPHTGLVVEAFRGYADHMDTATFRAALDGLIEASAAEPTAFMCAESDWRRCHRRMIADALCVRGHPVRHLVGDGGSEPHALHQAARDAGGGVLVYDVPSPRQGRLLDEP
jgi:uncharacterized protein (DUF488 family)